MRNHALLVLLSLLAVAFSTPFQAQQAQTKHLPLVISTLAVDDQDKSPKEKDLPETEETKQAFELAFGSKVEVSGLNGSVDIQTSNSSLVDIQIIRSARTREDLNFHKVLVDRTANSLKVHGEHQEGRGRDVRQRVRLKLPRGMELTVRAINGYVMVGDVDGQVKISAVNGKVELSRVASATEISGINGNVIVTVAQLEERGLKLDGINGKIEIRIVDGLNADISVTGINGNVHTEVPNMTVEGKITPSNFKGRLGSGGTPIIISGVNGSVRLVQAFGTH